MKKIIIYGMGKKGSECAKDIIRNANILMVQVVALMDRKEVDLRYDYPVYQPDMLCQLEFDFIVITSIKWYQIIKDELYNTYGIEKEKIILWRELLLAKGVKSEFYCNCCNNYVPYMTNIGYKAMVFEKKKIVGGGFREYAKCPYCESVDRNRWVEYVLENKTDIYRNSEAKILHFAPEDMIENKLRNGHPNYISADIRPIADVIEDITAISFDEHEFDYIICNHIMQDVLDDTKAFFELKRCIKEEGKIVFSVPICWDQETYENPEYNTEEERLQFYGQKEHVRIYGNDLKKRLDGYGLDITIYRVSEEMQKEQIQKMSLLEEDTVWILENKRK